MHTVKVQLGTELNWDQWAKVDAYAAARISDDQKKYDVHYEGGRVQSDSFEEVRDAVGREHVTHADLRWGGFGGDNILLWWNASRGHVDVTFESLEEARGAAETLRREIEQPRVEQAQIEQPQIEQPQVKRLQDRLRNPWVIGVATSLIAAVIIIAWVTLF